VREAGGENGQFLGQINSQRRTTWDGVITPEEAGEVEGMFIITAEDTTGALVEFIHPFTLFVEEGFGFDDEFVGGGFRGDDDFMWEEGGMMVRPMPGDREGVVIGGWEMEFGFEEPDEPGAITRFFRTVFTREVEPEGWDETFLGAFTPEAAAMRGLQPERGVRWLGVFGAVAVGIAVIAVPAVIVIRKKRSKLDFDDEE
jgi:hypothetical protein